MNFILSIIAILLFSIVYMIDEFICLFVDVRNRKWYKVSSERKFKKSFKVDVFANWLFPATWTVLFSRKGGYAFGRFGETLSSCLGRKKLDETLSCFGLVFYYILFAVDYSNWNNKGHCIKSIMTDENIKDFLNK